LFTAVTRGVYEEINKKYTQNLKEFIALCLKVDPTSRPSAATLLEKPYFAEFDIGSSGLIGDS